MNAPDLSFTKDEAWIARRRKAFEEKRKNLLENSRKKDVDAIEFFFLTGEVNDVLNSRLKKATSLGRFYLNNYPAISEESYDYLFSEVITDPSALSTFVNETLNCTNDYLYTEEENLVRFNYVHKNRVLETFEDGYYIYRKKNQKESKVYATTIAEIFTTVAIGNAFLNFKCWSKYKDRADFFLRVLKDFSSLQDDHADWDLMLSGLSEWASNLSDVFSGASPELVRQSQSYQEYVALIESIKDDIKPRLFNALIVF